MMFVLPLHFGILYVNHMLWYGACAKPSINIVGEPAKEAV